MVGYPKSLVDFGIYTNFYFEQVTWRLHKYNSLELSRIIKSFVEISRNI